MSCSVCASIVRLSRVSKAYVESWGVVTDGGSKRVGGGCTEGVVDTQCGRVGGGGHVVGAGEVESTEEVSSKGTGEVEAKGLVGPVAGEGGVVGGAEVMVGGEGLLPGGVGGGEDFLMGDTALYSNM